mmetsp:Transcript_67913/g.189656  ORF Transcript_67913/g.189656 Transcript_67913/m.189656 type:complete len:209 (-) Transcript_67913:142-768(-)
MNAEELALKQAEALRIFRRYDRNGDGKLQPKELYVVMEHIDPAYWTQANVDTLIGDIDANADGTINYQDFVAWVLADPEEKPAAAPTSVKLKIVRATGLRDADIIGKSDPFCEVRIPNKDVAFRTKTINGTLDPKWDEECVLANFLEGDALRFTVYDADSGIHGSDDLLGHAVLQRKDIPLEGFRGALPLQDSGMKTPPKLTVHANLV